MSNRASPSILSKGFFWFLSYGTGDHRTYPFYPSNPSNPFNPW